MTTLRIHNTLECSTVNGPGKRAVIWVQGCGLGCDGCWNPETWDAGAGTLMENGRILAWLAGLDVDGLSISGGEPMAQAVAAMRLILGVRVSLPHLSIGMFTGHTQNELARGRFECGENSENRRREVWSVMRDHLDFAVCGRFNRHQPASDPLVTSKNQELVLFSDRYRASDFSPQQVEIAIDPHGLTQLSGFPTKGML